MTKEELEKEAEEWLCNNLHSASEEDFIKAMVDFAEPREKYIAELKAQIEKMKCCGNCANLCGCGLRGYEECKNFDKWEIKEK